MNEFTKLRDLAREKRDKMIAAAYKEYAGTLVSIATVEQDLVGTVPSRHRTLTSCVEHMIPGDTSFTILDIVAKLEALDPSRIWHKHSVEAHVAVLRRKGLVVRLRRSKANSPAIYARKDANVPALTPEAMTLPQLLRALLKAGPMTTTELLLGVLDAGYQTPMSKRALRSSIRRELNLWKDAKQDGEKWAVG